MKKFTIYILILITLIGLLGFSKVNAQAGNGTCSIAVITSPTECSNQGGTYTFSPGCTDNTTGALIPGTDPGACYLAGGTYTDAPANTQPVIQSTYTYLAPLGTDKTFDPSQNNALSVYLNIIIKTLIGIAAVLAMIMIVMGGVEYMTSDIVSSKEAGKKRITDAIIGLLLALAAYLLLFTINPNLLKVEPNIPSSSFVSKTNPASLEYDIPSKGPSSNVGGTSTNNTKTQVTSGATFPDSGWQAAALAAVKNSGLVNTNPSDGAVWFGHAGPYTAEEWVSLLVGVASAESKFNPNATYVETKIDGTPTSVGLFQLSTGDCSAAVYGYGQSCTNTQLMDPIFNINLAVGILTRWVNADGVVATSNPYRGGARYWSTMRSK